MRRKKGDWCSLCVCVVLQMEHLRSQCCNWNQAYEHHEAEPNPGSLHEQHKTVFACVCVCAQVHTPDPLEVVGRRVSFDLALQLDVLPPHIPVPIVAQQQDVRSNCGHTHTHTKGSFRAGTARQDDHTSSNSISKQTLNITSYSGSLTNQTSMTSSGLIFLNLFSQTVLPGS